MQDPRYKPRVGQPPRNYTILVIKKTINITSDGKSKKKGGRELSFRLFLVGEAELILGFLGAVGGQ
jgi:hypothetical protein